MERVSGNWDRKGKRKKKKSWTRVDWKVLCEWCLFLHSPVIFFFKFGWHLLVRFVVPGSHHSRCTPIVKLTTDIFPEGPSISTHDEEKNLKNDQKSLFEV